MVWMVFFSCSLVHCFLSILLVGTAAEPLSLAITFFISEIPTWLSFFLAYFLRSLFYLLRQLYQSCARQAIVTSLPGRCKVQAPHGPPPTPLRPDPGQLLWPEKEYECQRPAWTRGTSYGQARGHLHPHSQGQWHLAVASQGTPRPHSAWTHVPLPSQLRGDLSVESARAPLLSAALGGQESAPAGQHCSTPASLSPRLPLAAGIPEAVQFTGNGGFLAPGLEAGSPSGHC